MHVNEKLGPRPANVSRIFSFCHLVKQCGFFDLGFCGSTYTWSNKQFNANPTF
jgi:hypothetical protein